jgi:dTDP-4-amino-4,6-dideoxygalactose transaminase
MAPINEIAERHGLYVIEDAAQAINGFYDGRALGSLGHLGAYSFHDTKNVTCGEGGALCINRPELLGRAEVIRDKGTNRQQFIRREVEKYVWVDVGSSYVPSEILCAFLYAQLEQIEIITARRRAIHEFYCSNLKWLEEEGYLTLPTIPRNCRSNYHTFFVLLPDRTARDGLLSHLHAQGIGATFHYVPLHTSPMGRKFGYKEGDLPLTENLSERLLRLPVYHG